MFDCQMPVLKRIGGWPESRVKITEHAINNSSVLCLELKCADSRRER